MESHAYTCAWQPSHSEGCVYMNRYSYVGRQSISLRWIPFHHNMIFISPPCPSGKPIAWGIYPHEYRSSSACTCVCDVCLLRYQLNIILYDISALSLLDAVTIYHLLCIAFECGRYNMNRFSLSTSAVCISLHDPLWILNMLTYNFMNSYQPSSLIPGKS